MPAQPTFFQRVADRWAATRHGGVRVRVLDAGPPAVGVATGRVAKLPSQKLLRLVLELEPEAPGTVDVMPARDRWRVTTGGRLASPRLEQRLRNVLGNL